MVHISLPFLIMLRFRYAHTCNKCICHKRDFDEIWLIKILTSGMYNRSFAVNQ